MPQQPMGIESYLASGAQECVLGGREQGRIGEVAVEEVAVEQPCPNPRVRARVTARVRARVTARVRVPQPPPAAVRLRLRVGARLRVSRHTAAAR